MDSVPTRRNRSLSAAAVALSLSLLLAACSGGSTKTSSGSASSTAPGGSSGTSGSGRMFPGTSGKVASLSRASMEVQGSSGQKTVSWSPSTAFHRTVILTSSSLTPGDCVTVQGSTSDGKIVARTITVGSPSSSGTCASGLGGGGPVGGATAGGPGAGGAPPANGNFTPPSGSGAGSGGSIPANAANVSFVTGKVVSVAGSSLVVNGSRVGKTTASEQTVTLDSSTDITQNKSATWSNLAVGDCVTATGSTSSTSAVSATAVTITSTGSSTCAGGFGGFGSRVPPNQGNSSNA